MHKELESHYILGHNYDTTTNSTAGGKFFNSIQDWESSVEV